MINRSVKVYENGFRHVHYYVSFVKTVNMAFVVQTGSSDEKVPEHFGISHFLEHMLFNGSEKYPNTLETDQMCARLGVYQNAWTFFSETTYYMQSSPGSIKSAFDILFQRVYKPLLRQEDVEKEIGIIQEERVMRENQPLNSLFWDVFAKVNSGTTYAHEVIGTKPSIGGMNNELLRDYHDIYYSAENSILVTYGGVEFEHIDKIVSKSLQNIERKDVPSHDVQISKRKPTVEKVKLELKKDVDISYYISVLQAEKVKDISSLAKVATLNSLLSCGEGSILNQELMIKRSLVSSYYYALILTRDNTISEFDASFPAANKDQVYEIVNEVLEKPSKYLDEKSFERAKNYSYGMAVRDMENVRLTAQTTYNNVELFNLRNKTDYSQEDLLNEIKGVKMDEVVEFSDKFFATDVRGEGFAIPLKNEPSYG